MADGSAPGGDRRVGDLLARAEAWVADDPDPLTAAAVEDLLRRIRAGTADEAITDELAELFRARLEFGTAGLRGALGPGPNRMNRVVVRRAAAGVAAWVNGHGGGRRLVAIGRDARHGSAAFLDDSVAVLAGAGLDVVVLPEPCPTPVLAFAVRHLGAAAGIMVTASHNPASDNGYKVYDAEGRQLDAEQAAAVLGAMDLVERVTDLPLAGPGAARVTRAGEEIVDAYLASLVGLLGAPRTQPRVAVAHTALHGVGAATVRAAAWRVGFVDLHEVDDQAVPDPDFPTVAFPNPEEPGALDRLLEQAAWSRADVALANDPDADRLAMAVVDPPGRDPHDPASWRPLSGDELGWLLADHLVRRGDLPADGVMATTIVSSSLLRALAADAGVAYAETLTGFKWVARAPGAHQRLAFGYEEALGYCVGDVVHDKDGIGALLVAAEMVSDVLAAGESIPGRLDDLARRFGVHHTRQWSVRLEGGAGAARIAAAMDALRAGGPDRLADAAVTRVEDLAFGSPERMLPPSDVVILTTDGGRVVVRPSGTEPKLKAYVEVVEPVGADGDLPAARARAAERADAVVAALPAALGL